MVHLFVTWYDHNWLCHFLGLFHHHQFLKACEAFRLNIYKIHTGRKIGVELKLIPCAFGVINNCAIRCYNFYGVCFIGRYLCNKTFYSCVKGGGVGLQGKAGVYGYCCVGKAGGGACILNSCFTLL